MEIVNTEIFVFGGFRIEEFVREDGGSNIAEQFKNLNNLVKTVDTVAQVDHSAPVPEVWQDFPHASL